ncbi:uncharacterized protein A1O5_04364 [Cladophialophora psammophila CBS 110553]|uniref:NAD dependent epimerase/dehydratase n=1 Tax=Cladophialophora psammophila CBS 110553 TaxID=1182543 RepID=W9WVC2_9EURO|nr:uncharacterized protein A1O5_04364 [Cladophialophora psammophila CBS 110553]EXJ71863.1 hypothetical protein A1O5_04364 [Cladophialophora psammophila CBS 110553]
MAKEASSQSHLAKFFGISADEHGDSQWRPDSTAGFEVIGLGLSRTGTTSLREALTMLGFGPVHHGVEIYRRPDHRERVIKFMHWLSQHPRESETASEEMKKRLRALTRGYRSTMDAPMCDLIPEVVATYPDAKFILTVRDSEESWWRSWNESIGHQLGTGPRRVVYRSLISSVHLLRRMDDLCQEIRIRLERDWGSIKPRMYRMHNQRVRELVPQGRLLEYNVKDGWGPLCAFLDVEVPDRPFPKLNEGANIKAIYIGHQVFGAATWAFYLGLIVGAMYLAAKPRIASAFLQSALKRVGLRSE